MIPLLAAFAVGQFVPEHLLRPAEVELSVRGEFWQSSATLPPQGKALTEDYRELGFDIGARVGVTSFLTLALELPLVHNHTLDNGLLAITRFGDPTAGLFIGGALGPLQVVPFGEITFPGSANVTLYRSDTALMLPDRGVVVATGGVSANLGLMLAFRPRFDGAALETSVRGCYRVRSAGASDGAGFDARVRLILRERWIVGATADGLWAYGGDNQAFISPSRMGDGASWLDAGLLAGIRAVSWLDIQVIGEAPLWAAASGLFVQAHLQFLFHWGAQ